MRTHHRAFPCALALAASTVLNACAADTPTGGATIHAMSAQADHRLSGWSDAVNVGPVVNSAFNEILPHQSPDGLSLYFASDRPGGFGAFDIWVSRRASADAPWGTPVNLGGTINTAAAESAPDISRDGHLLFFASGRPGGAGTMDLWVSRRDHTDDDFAWEPPSNLGPNINTAAFEAGAALARPEFYFTSTRDNAPNLDIFVSRLEGNSFTPATFVSELSSAANDQRPTVRFDGREIFFSSNRGTGDQNIWVATRQDRASPWSALVMLGPEINTQFLEQQPSISADGAALFFASTRPGGSGGGDLYVTTRRLAH